jgi:choline monooxygenase
MNAIKPLQLPVLSSDGLGLPPAAFTSRARYDEEMAAIFAHSWVHVADLPDFARPGDYAAATIGLTPVVVVRGDDGTLRGFLNACRHRGATLVEGAGNCGRQLRCPYHAWSYTTDGRLVGVPHQEEFGCRAEGLNLVPVRVGVVGPMVFACLDPEAPPVEEWVGELGPALARARAGEMQLAFELDYEVAVNWKVYVENGLDGYHVQFVHDVLADFVEIKNVENGLEPHASYTWAPISAQYRGMLPPPAHLSEADSRRVRFGHVFPNLIPVLTPGDLSYLRIDPIGPERVRVHARSFDLGGDFAQMRDFRKDAMDRTNRQDMAVVERVQRGLNATGLPAGIHASMLECRISHFERRVTRALER